MNIALVILHADPARGGAERYTGDLAAGLTGMGHTVSLLASSFGQIPPGVASVPLASRGLTRLGRYKRFLSSLEERLADNRYDVVHAMLPVRRCDVYHPHAGIAAEAVGGEGRSSRGDLAGQINRLNFKRRFFAQVERELLTGPRPPVVVCLSSYIRQTALRHYPQFPLDHLPTVFNGVDLNRFEPGMAQAASLRQELNLPADGTLGLMIAQDFERKGLGQAIEALARVADRQLRLVVVGKPDPSAYRRLAKSLGVEARIIFAGRSSRPQAYYGAADFFVLPTRHDPCSLVVLEALAMGLPVISTAQNGACEIMTEGQHGWVLPNADDIPRLAGAMTAMLDRQRRQLMRQACLALRPRLSQQCHVRRMVQVYEGHHD